MENSIPNIYFEIQIPNSSTEKLWNEFIETQQFIQLFKDIKDHTELFQANQHGDIEFSMGLFHKFSGEYHILSCEKYKNFLFDIISEECTSTILLTMEENNGTVLLRLDHRSFVGNKRKQHHKNFYNRWKKVFNLLHKKEKQAV
ncbi:MAG: SRPBCC domain-containing protein [Brevinema sp.]